MEIKNKPEMHGKIAFVEVEIFNKTGQKIKTKRVVYSPDMKVLERRLIRGTKIKKIESIKIKVLKEWN